LWATSLEALLLLLAFVDRFALVQSEKEQLHADFLLEYNLRQKIIENEVAEKTETLSETIKQKELLFKELHHRVKNNLQLILSLIRIQHDYSTCGEEGTMLTQLEGRISAIARTHELLYQSSGDERVDMDVYVQDYVESMDASLRDLNLELQSDVEATLPLKEAVYVGLIINELVSNAMKYAYEKEGGIIHIRLHESGQVKTLEVCDEGKGYNEQLVEEKSLGLVLVHTLVEEQLEGTLELDITEGTHYTIRFVI
jgi:two-component sensor histidine kinase